MKIIKHISFSGENADLVAFITGGKTPMVFISYDNIFNEDFEYESSIKSAADIKDTNLLHEYLLKMPFEAFRKIAKTKITKKKISRKR